MTKAEILSIIYEAEGYLIGVATANDEKNVYDDGINYAEQLAESLHKVAEVLKSI